MPPRVLVLVFCCSALEKAKYQLKTYTSYFNLSLSSLSSLSLSFSRGVFFKSLSKGTPLLA
jgi:hypothetical protein